MTKRTPEQRDAIYFFYRDDIYRKRNTSFGIPDPNRLSWQEQVRLGQERFPDLVPPLTFSDINSAFMRLRRETKKAAKRLVALQTRYPEDVSNAELLDALQQNSPGATVAYLIEAQDEMYRRKGK